jgi:uncharacterized protein (TIGR03905 family)
VEYTTKGTCSKKITFTVENGIVQSVAFTGGCGGNLQGISRLVAGKRADEVIAALSGIQCRATGNVTSCPDQLAQALKAYAETP